MMTLSSPTLVKVMPAHFILEAQTQVLVSRIYTMSHRKVT